jgi:hypothetical protein
VRVEEAGGQRHPRPEQGLGAKAKKAPKKKATAPKKKSVPKKKSASKKKSAPKKKAVSLIVTV